MEWSIAVLSTLPLFKEFNERTKPKYDDLNNEKVLLVRNK